MNPGTFRLFARRCCAFVAAAGPLLAQAAVVPDRTRVIYEEGMQAVSVTVTNKSPKYPYLIQSWIEDRYGQKIDSPFLVLPPLQRIEPNDRNVMRVVLLPGLPLPADRESLFYLNIREIPPKSDTPNALQIALHSKLKLFYRPAAAKRDRDDDTPLPMTVQFDGAAHRLVFDNPSPWYVTVVELKAGTDHRPLPFSATMVAPMSRADVPFNAPAPDVLYVSHMDDYGGQIEVRYVCGAGLCRSTRE